MLKAKMTKREREVSVLFSDIGSDGFITVEYNGKKYAWLMSNEGQVSKLTDDHYYTCEIIHNVNNQAMINFIDIKTDEDFLRQEINPLDRKNCMYWCIDD
jgi:hypothetical protein